MLDARLTSVAKFVRQGAIFADIGTDHAHLPLFLLASGRIKRAVCSDINEGPLDSARRNIGEAGLTDRTEFFLTDGAAALGGRGITDVAICGMGGELIADIIDRALWLRSGGVRLILQPMTRAGDLRTYLCTHGFGIIHEDFSHSMGKYYVSIVAEYTAEEYSLSETEARLGKEGWIFEKNDAYYGYLTTVREACMRRLSGKRAGGVDTASDERLLLEIEKRREGRYKGDC